MTCEIGKAAPEFRYGWRGEFRAPKAGPCGSISLSMSFEDALIEVWHQVLVESEDAVKLGAERYPVIVSKAKRLRQVTFMFDGNTIIGIEQNPKTKSRWALMARSGKKVMQFIQERRYVAVVADGKVILYGSKNPLE